MKLRISCFENKKVGTVNRGDCPFFNFYHLYFLYFLANCDVHISKTRMWASSFSSETLSYTWSERIYFF